MNLLALTHTIDLARSAGRLPHWALAVLMTPVLVILGQLGALPVALVLKALFPGGSASIADQPLVSSAAFAAILIASFGGVILLTWVWVRWFERRSFWTLGFERAGAAWKYARGFGFGLLAFGGSIAILGTTGLTTLDHIEGAAVGGILIVLVGWLVQGAAEEIVTRGWLLNVIGARYRPWLGVLASVLIFSLLHGLNPNIGPLPWWSFYVLLLMAITGTAVPFVHLLNRRFVREPVPAGVILRQGMWTGVFVTTGAWMQRSGLLNPATIVLLLVALVGVEWFLRLRERARWSPADDDD